MGKVLKLGVAERYEHQLDYWGPHKLLEVSLFARVPGTEPILSDGRLWLAAHSMLSCALLAVGFSMEPVEQLPLSWPPGLRRPAGRRRLGPAYVMDGGVLAQLSPLLARSQRWSQGRLLSESSVKIVENRLNPEKFSASGGGLRRRLRRAL